MFYNILHGFVEIDAGYLFDTINCNVIRSRGHSLRIIKQHCNGAAAKDKPTSFDLRTEFRIGTWNVLTLAKTGYKEAICQEYRKYRISLAGLTETHLLGSGRLDIDDHIVIHSGEEQEHRRGVALVLASVVASHFESDTHSKDASQT